MSRYFFHTESDIRHTDEEGVELPNLDAARTHAVRAVGEVLLDSARKFWGSQPWTLTVTDHAGLIFFTIELHGMDAPAAL